MVTDEIGSAIEIFDDNTFFTDSILIIRTNELPIYHFLVERHLFINGKRADPNIIRVYFAQHFSGRNRMFRPHLLTSGSEQDIFAQ